MAVSQFCHLQVLGVVLACLLIGTITCGLADEKEENQERTNAEKQLKSDLKGGLEVEKVLEKLNEFKWKDVLLCAFTVEQAIALSQPDVSECRLSKFKRIESTIHKYKPNRPHLSGCSKYKGLFSYLDHYFKEYAKFCLDKIDKVFEDVFESKERDMLAYYDKTLGEIKEKKNKIDVKMGVHDYVLGCQLKTGNFDLDFEGPLRRTCKLLVQQVFDLVDYSRELVFKKSREEWNFPNFPHLRQGCKKFPEPIRELNSGSLADSGIAYAVGGDFSSF